MFKKKNREESWLKSENHFNNSPHIRTLKDTTVILAEKNPLLFAGKLAVTIEREQVQKALLFTNKLVINNEKVYPVQGRSRGSGHGAMTPIWSQIKLCTKQTMAQKFAGSVGLHA